MGAAAKDQLTEFNKEAGLELAKFCSQPRTHGKGELEMKRVIGLKQFLPAVMALVLLGTAASYIAAQDPGSRRLGGELFGSATVPFRGGHSASFVQGGAAATALDSMFFIADRAYTVTGIKAVWGTAEATGDMDVMVERLQGTEACSGGAGDNLQTAAIDASSNGGGGTAATVNSATLTTTVADRTLAVGDRLCLNLTATPNEILNLVVTVYFDATTAAGIL